MHSLCRAVMAAVLFAACGFASTAAAGVFGGNLERVDASTGRISVVSSTGNIRKTYRLADSVPITLDGKPAKIGDLQVGMRAAVFSKSNGTVLRVRVRSKTAAAKKTASKRTTAKSSGNTSAAKTAPNTDWPQFRGPNRDNISRETGLLKSWPDGGPKLVWKATGLGDGYSAVAVVDGVVYTMGNRSGDEMVIALDLNTGKELWATRNGNAYRDSRGNGPRGTPTVDGGFVYALGGNGDLSCLSAKEGRVRWRKNILKEFDGDNISWGISESVLIDGEKLICTPGGTGATVVALNKNTGKLIWKSAVPGNPEAAYASPIAVEVGGVRQYVVFHGEGVVGIRAADGRPMWSDDSSANGTANCATPLFSKGHVFTASDYGKGGALLKLQSRGTITTARRVYHTRDMKNHHGGMVIVDGHLYGSNSGILTCLELVTGKVKWRERTGKGAVTYADGHIYFRSERGPVVLLEATPAAYREKSRFDQPDRSDEHSWSHPVIAGGKLFLRDMDVLLCYDVKSRN